MLSLACMPQARGVLGHAPAHLPVKNLLGHAPACLPAPPACSALPAQMTGREVVRLYARLRFAAHAAPGQSRARAGQPLATSLHALLPAPNAAERRLRSFGAPPRCALPAGIGQALTLTISSPASPGRGLPERLVPAEAARLLKRLGLPEYADRACGSYSGGNRRKLSVAVALVGGAEVSCNAAGRARKQLLHQCQETEGWNRDWQRAHPVQGNDVHATPSDALSLL